MITTEIRTNKFLLYYPSLHETHKNEAKAKMDPMPWNLLMQETLEVNMALLQQILQLKGSLLAKEVYGTQVDLGQSALLET